MCASSKMSSVLWGVFLLLLNATMGASTTMNNRAPEKPAPGAGDRDVQPIVRVNKCCETYEVVVDKRCTLVNETNLGVWSPVFTDGQGRQNAQVKHFNYVIGLPACGSTQRWTIYHYPTSTDKLELLSNGRLRHYIHQETHSEYVDEDVRTEPRFYDYDPGQYCMDKVFTTDNNLTAEYALVCAPEVLKQWSDLDFLLKKIINPIFHGISIAIFLTIAIIFFVLPTLRDLVGNIITTITMCLIVSQAAGLVLIFIEFSNHVSFLSAEMVMYLSLQAAFFWLNGMGYYIWRTFRSRNVFLRSTDGRKYCWYSGFSWTCTLLMGGMAIFAHFALDTVPSSNAISKEQPTVGWLGIAMFFTPIAFTVLVNTFFYVTTQQIINRMNTYGRIHHKLKNSFKIFVQLLIVMFTSWLFLVLSLLDYDALLYAHIFVNALQAPFILYICVIQQKHVTFILKKSCCYSEQPVPTNDWGDEMTQMNGDY